jgi:AraC family ethanolamine operon transcriptional activator
MHRPLARDALRSQLIDAICCALMAIEKRAACRKGRPLANRRDVLRCVLALIEARIDEPLRLGELCTAARVSPGTLQAVFSEQFGLSAHRYLMLRRLHAIHGALRKSTPTDTISSICARYGVWDFGRFATQYRRHFGVPPSRTLNRKQVARTH